PGRESFISGWPRYLESARTLNGPPIADRNFTCYPLVTWAGLLIWCGHPLERDIPWSGVAGLPRGGAPFRLRHRGAAAGHHAHRPAAGPGHPGAHRDPGAARARPGHLWRAVRPSD